MRSRFPTTLLAMLACLTCAARAAVVETSAVDARNAPAIYQSAGEAYEAGDFSKAISLYEELVRAQWGSDSLFLNLGTAHFRNGSPGRAVLWFRRAAMLSPGMPELNQNFAYLRARLGFLEFSDSPWKRSLLALSPRLLEGGAWSLLWLGLFGLLWVYQSNSPVRKAVLPGSILALTIAALFYAAGAYRSARLAPENFATVVTSKTAALVAPAPDSKPVLDLPEGSELRILQDTGPWVYALMPGNLVGWVHHRSIERNWPIPGPEAARIGKAWESADRATVALSR